VLHVPLIVRYPVHVPGGIRIAGQVRLMDVGPTMLALAGQRVQRGRDARRARAMARDSARLGGDDRARG